MTNEQQLYEPGWLPDPALEAFRTTLRLGLRALTDFRAYGTEHVPPGGFIVTSNHLSWWDSLMVFSPLPKRHFTAFGADKYRYHPVFSPVMRAVGVIWVNRGATSPSAVKAAITAVKAGQALGVAPEGTRSRETHALLPGKEGAAFLALTTGALIQPVGLINPDRIMTNLRRFKRIPLIVHFGQPYCLTAAPGQRERATAEKLATATHEIMCRIGALLPERYHGVYKGDPRLKELQAQTPLPPGVEEIV